MGGWIAWLGLLIALGHGWQQAGILMALSFTGRGILVGSTGPTPQ